MRRLALILMLALAAHPWAQPADAQSLCQKLGISPVKHEIQLDSTGVSSSRYTNRRAPAPVVSYPSPRQLILAGVRSFAYSYCAYEAEIAFRNTSASDAFIVTIPYRNPSLTWAKASTDIKNKGAALATKCDPATLAGDSMVCQSYAAEKAAIDKILKAGLEPCSDPTIPSGEKNACQVVELEKRLFALWPKKESEARSVIRAMFEETSKAAAAARDVTQVPVECDTKDNCSFVITLYETDSFRLSEAAEINDSPWARIVAGSTGRVVANVAFFEERTAPSRAAAYLRVNTAFDETPSKVTWKTTGSFGYSNDPVLDTNAEDKIAGFVSPSAPYDKAHRRRYPTVARLTVTQNLGDRAEASMVGQYKRGDLGETDQSSDFKAALWQVSLFGLSGAEYRYGKFQFARPAEGIAISEAGEGWQISYKALSFGNILKRESLTGIADRQDDDSEVFLLQARSVPLAKILPRKLSWFPIRHFDAYWLEGTSNRKLSSGGFQQPYDYSTYGLEVAFRLPEEVSCDNWYLSGRTAYFESDRDVDQSFVPPANSDGTLPTVRPVRDGSGKTGLFEFSANNAAVSADDKRAKSLRTVTLRFAWGRGDNPQTPDYDEGYIGETNGFAPDNLFLSSFAGNLRSDADPTVMIASNDDLPEPLVRAGLSNKEYRGLTWVERKYASKFSPLHLAIRLIGSVDDIESESFTLRIHSYRFNQGVLDQTDAGEEIGLQWLIEVPKGVKTTLDLGRLFVGPALEPFFTEDPWVIKASVSVSI